MALTNSQEPEVLYPYPESGDKSPPPQSLPGITENSSKAIYCTELGSWQALDSFFPHFLSFYFSLSCSNPGS
jgi:hypothetical protein